jgi:hypothetical protein
VALEHSPVMADERSVECWKIGIPADTKEFNKADPDVGGIPKHSEKSNSELSKRITRLIWSFTTHCCVTRLACSRLNSRSGIDFHAVKTTVATGSQWNQH